MNEKFWKENFQQIEFAQVFVLFGPTPTQFALATVPLKGVCHEIFDLQFFFMIQTHLGPW